ncbi:MAG: hypothetical protein ACK4IY_02785 [Chitinophagales bacterium]
MMKKLSAAVESDVKHSNAVFWNVVSKGPEQDAAIVWTFDKFAEWNENTLKPLFEKVHGEDSWRKFNEEWEEVVVSYTEEIREVIK